ncbi:MULTISPECIES: hypothetical protein [Lactobacillaceae]|uniref:hypothetical protein n=1 Tax=Lactobacillaceae TaxID=33958 RepID=UPI0008636FDE|nr:MULTISPECIES: hypothetical protein [Lactobacillaceae]APB86751.1 hypothetical protein BL295_13530 [Lactiplantibacillus plantarum]ARO01687.1 hypothetical protein BIZ31_12970 [Lactiplantibacillus plantarum]ARO04594.1 hypothetical protein BIZ32_12780 [Lactiplantibacillus plantarum]MCG0621886.1 hypothetical protein [Lactiplantibacillus plantarum]MCG0893966.1 hypothetical protein [Lactiplantibacillus plantarum]
MDDEVELLEAKRQIDSTVHKIQEVIKTLEAKEDPDRYKSQLTLAKRRLKAFGIATQLIDDQLDECVLKITINRTLRVNI